ncbi:MAG: site-specific DNA-methyltransferase, partial [Thermoguttaceae bacterium]|nr:site-specific DNA-methyltransferase [Thermoguttaceae bacterium]
MEKNSLQTPDLTARNVDKIAELFPNCVTEMQDETGSLKRVVNFDALKQALSGSVVEGNESYEFTWVGKKAAAAEAFKPCNKTLRPCPEESVDWDNTQNLYIEGDNLDALKLLREKYQNKVKMIY